MENKYSLIMPFLDGSQSFTNGFEVGQIWSAFKYLATPEPTTVHTENIEQLKLVAQYYKHDMICIPTEYEEWSEVTFVKQGPTLRIVK